MLGEEVGVAHSREPRLLLRRASARASGRTSRSRAAARSRFTASLSGAAARNASSRDVADDQPVGAEGLLVEERRRAQAERLVERAVEHLRVARDVDPELVDQALGHRAVRRRAVDRLRAAVADVACGRRAVNSLRLAWPPKSSWLSRIRMRASGRALRKKYAAARPLMPPPTTTRSYSSPVSCRRRRVFQNGAVAQRVQNFERSDVRAAQAGQRRRIGAAGLREQPPTGRRAQAPANSAAEADGDAVQEVAAGDRRGHAKAAVVELVM